MDAIKLHATKHSNDIRRDQHSTLPKNARSTCRRSKTMAPIFQPKHYLKTPKNSSCLFYRKMIYYIERASSSHCWHQEKQHCFGQVFSISWAILKDLHLIGYLFLARATFNKLQNFSLSPLEKNLLLYRMSWLQRSVAPGRNGKKCGQM